MTTALNKSNNHKILTPHAAVIVWNYSDRISGDPDGVIDEEGISFTLISTVSCISIHTNKSKGAPAGSFDIVLAPTKNWVSALTAGSWCAILMSTNPITKSSISTADPDQVKMFGKIESVRADVSVDANGARQTRYMITGTDWGHIFNNTLYIDNLINVPGDPGSLGNAAAVAIRNMLFGRGNSPQSFAVKDNLNSLLNVFGNNLDGFTEQGNDINRLAKATYDFIIPQEVADFFKFVVPTAPLPVIPFAPIDNSESRVITKLLNLETGILKDDGTYNPVVESYGYINPYSLQGTNTFWQILMDNGNPALNEMYNDIQWTSDGRPKLTLYNRIRPFSVPKPNPSPNAIRSLFTYVKIHEIDLVTVTAVNVGTNWRDKYNFVEIKPQFQDFAILDNWIKTKSQVKDQTAFNREGFRPFMVATKQFPIDPNNINSLTVGFAADQLEFWAKLLSEWYFDTHRLLNGTIAITGQNEYISVGNNIRFDAGLINPTPNMNVESNNKHNNNYVLAHVENVSHSFSVREDGAREYMTSIQFVRGIIVDGAKQPNVIGEGTLDQFTAPDPDAPPDEQGLSKGERINTANTIVSANKDSPHGPNGEEK